MPQSKDFYPDVKYGDQKKIADVSENEPTELEALHAQELRDFAQNIYTQACQKKMSILAIILKK